MQSSCHIIFNSTLAYKVQLGLHAQQSTAASSGHLGARSGVNGSAAYARNGKKPLGERFCTGGQSSLAANAAAVLWWPEHTGGTPIQGSVSRTVVYNAAGVCCCSAGVRGTTAR